MKHVHWLSLIDRPSNESHSTLTIAEPRKQTRLSRMLCAEEPLLFHCANGVGGAL